MNKNRNFIESFLCAVSGFFHALYSERNLRFHSVVTVLVVIFALHFGLNKLEWAVLVLAITFVLVCELINTAVENAVDTATREFSVTAKIAKDVAAGAVLVSAVSAVIIGFILFFDIRRITVTLHSIIVNPLSLVLTVITLLFGGFFVLFWGKK